MNYNGKTYMFIQESENEECCSNCALNEESLSSVCISAQCSGGYLPYVSSSTA